jgi:hypothetical protein
MLELVTLFSLLCDARKEIQVPQAQMFYRATLITADVWLKV